MNNISLVIFIKIVLVSSVIANQEMIFLSIIRNENVDIKFIVDDTFLKV